MKKIETEAGGEKGCSSIPLFPIEPGMGCVRRERAFVLIWKLDFEICLGFRQKRKQKCAIEICISHKPCDQIR